MSVDDDNRVVRMVSFARIDAPHLADGLFIITRGVDGRGKNRKVAAKWGAIDLEFACVEPLGVAEQSVLLALVARAGISGKPVAADGKTTRSRALHASLSAAGDSLHRKGIMVSTTVSQLVKDVGLRKCGTATGSVEAALRRLGNVVVWIRDNVTGREGNTLMLSVSLRADSLDVAMNYRIREALMSTGYTRIDLDERRALRSDSARLVHAFLSRWLRPSHQREIALDSLAKHVWDDGLSSEKSTRKHRRATLRAALAECASLPKWTVAVHGRTVSLGRGASENTRPRAVRIPAPGGENTHPRVIGQRGAEKPVESRFFVHSAVGSRSRSKNLSKRF